MKRDEYKCVACGWPFTLAVRHIVTRELGGDDSRGNLTMLDRLPTLEARIIRAGLSILSILSFAAFFVHEAWKILKPLLSP